MKNTLMYLLLPSLASMSAFAGDNPGVPASTSISGE